MTHRVVQWSTANVGRHAIAGVDARPAPDPVGVWVPDPANRLEHQAATCGRLVLQTPDLGRVVLQQHASARRLAVATLRWER